MTITSHRALHADGSTHFQSTDPYRLAGTLTADGTSVTFMALDGEVVTFHRELRQRRLHQDRQQE